jgi:hypothetical protein
MSGKGVSMNPNNLMAVKVVDGVAMVYSCGNFSSKIQLIGASMKTNIDNPGMRTESFCLELGKDSTGVFAVKVIYFDKTAKEECFLIGVRKIDNGNKIEVVLKHQYVPLPGRFVNIDDTGRIKVGVMGIVFTNFHFKFNSGHSEYRIVHANVLCRYAAGLIDELKLKSASIEHIKAITQAEQFQNLNDRISKLENKLLSEQLENREAKNRINQLLYDNNELKSVNDILKKNNQELSFEAAKVKPLEDVLKIYREKFDAFVKESKKRTIFFRKPVRDLMHALKTI